MAIGVTHEKFEGLVNKKMTVHYGKKKLKMKLTQVEVGKAISKEFRVPFSLILAGPKDKPIDQTVCRLEHEDAGEHEALIVPIGEDEESQIYQIVFN